jgi:hypothetical protein
MVPSRSREWMGVLEREPTTAAALTAVSMVDGDV